MAGHTVMVGALSHAHLNRRITLSNGEETHTDTLLSVTHDAEGTHIETQTHWQGTWSPTDTCEIENEGGRA